MRKSKIKYSHENKEKIISMEEHCGKINFPTLFLYPEKLYEVSLKENNTEFVGKSSKTI